MASVMAMTGNNAAAEAMRQINPDVCAAYPITPSTEIMQIFASFVADGEVNTELVAVESEHSAMSACIGASAAGGRVMTATSANGLALMWEMLYVAAGLRLPIVMTLVNRALSGPLNIHADHSDAMGARDSGWIQLFSENGQEAYDNLLQAFLLAEDYQVRLPVMVCMDGFIISHSIERMEMLEDSQVRSFIGKYKPFYPLLDTDNPVSYGLADLQNYYMEHKRQQAEGMRKAKEVILKVGEAFAGLSGRKYSFFDEYRLDDAEIAILTMGSSAGTARVVVDTLRESGVRAGLVKLRVFRPFPHDELAEALAHLKALAVMDRADSFGAAGGPLFSEVRSAVFDLAKPPRVVNYIYGLGGRDIFIDDFMKVFNNLEKIAESGKIEQLSSYLSVRD